VIATGHPEVSIERRCELLGLPRASYYRGPASRLRCGDLELMRRIDMLYMEQPWMGSRSLADHLTTPDSPVGRDRIRRLMLVMGIESLAPKPGTSRRQPKHPVYPYLLRGVTIDRPNQVWATGITYIPMARGYMYLIAIMDWITRIGSGLAIVQYAGYQVLRRGAERGSFQKRSPEDLQYRPGLRVYQRSIHLSPQGLEHQDQHGRQRAFQGQHLH
jgi:transposase InsO family protein